MAVEISTVEELQAISSGLTGEYVIVNDIDASATSGWNSGEGFVPVGPTTGSAFSGSLDFAGYIIDGLFINRPSNDYVALFGNTNGATIAKPRFSNLNITGRSYVAALVGRAASTTITQGELLSGSVEATVSDSTALAGGLAGILADSSSSVTDSYSKISVTASGNGTRVGGFVGDNRGSLIRCYSTGAVVGTGSQTGGLTGFQSGGVFTGCFWDTQTSGKATSAGGTGKTTAEMKTLATFSGAGWDIVSGIDDTKIWGIGPGINDGYPFLQVFQDGGDEPDPIEASLFDVDVPLKVESAVPTTEFESTLSESSAAIQAESATPTTSFTATLHDIVISPEVESVTASAGQLATLGIVSQLIEVDAMDATTAYAATLHDIELPLAVEHAEPSFTEIPQTNLSDSTLPVEVDQMTPTVSYTASLYDISLPLEVFSGESPQPVTGNVFGLKTASGYFFLKV